jgi:hypothetical protein
MNSISSQASRYYKAKISQDSAKHSHFQLYILNVKSLFNFLKLTISSFKHNITYIISDLREGNSLNNILFYGDC